MKFAELAARTRRIDWRLYAIAFVLYGLGVWFFYVDRPENALFCFATALGKAFQARWDRLAGRQLTRAPREDQSP